MSSIKFKFISESDNFEITFYFPEIIIASPGLVAMMYSWLSLGSIDYII